jgi:signal transduction histidine kinase
LSTPSLFERLSQHRTVGAAPEAEIAWVAAQGVLHHLPAGGVLTSKDGQVEGVHFVLDGHLTIHVDRGTGRRKIMEWRGGDVTGLMPYSRLISPPGDVVAEQPTEIVTIYRKDMPGLIRECHELTTKLVQMMLDRARHFQSSYLHDEKLVSIGKLAAGLAHELNNPAAAIARSAGRLFASIRNAETAARALGGFHLTPDGIAAVGKLSDRCIDRLPQSILSPLEQEEREDSIARWLKGHSMDAAAADALAETDVTIKMLEELAATLKGEALTATVQWIAASCTTQRLTSEIQEAAARISDLVAAIKGFTAMDRESVPEPVDIGRGLANTLTVLRAKAKNKSVGMVVNVEDALPAVSGFGGELNQVWANLIDNALDAVDQGGRVELKAQREKDSVVVRVIDNGPGVPADIRDRIFDPFFTTKPIGEGTGLGLDIVRRLIQRHNGEIELDSRPGFTEFRVTLPISQNR